MAHKKSVLTEKQDAFVNGLLDGKSKSKAAANAGYASSAAGALAIQSQDVQEALIRARAELTDVLQVRRVDMIEVIVDAISMARLQGDPANMINGAREISKMLGFYEPEKKVIELTGSQEQIKKKYEQLSDEELLAIIEGEAKRVEN